MGLLEALRRRRRSGRHVATCFDTSEPTDVDLDDVTEKVHEAGSFVSNIVDWWIQSTDPSVLREDVRRLRRPVIIAVVGFTVFCMLHVVFYPRMDFWSEMAGLTLLAFNLILAKLSVEAAHVVWIDWALCLAVFMTMYYIGLMHESADNAVSPLEFRLADMACAYLFMEHMLIGIGTHPLALLAWNAATWSFCWLGDDRGIKGDLILVSASFLVFHFFRDRAQLQLRRERLAAVEKQQELQALLHAQERQVWQQQVLEQKQLRVKEQKRRMEESLSIVLQRLKTPLLLAKSEISPEPQTPSATKFALKAAHVRIEQIMDILTGLEQHTRPKHQEIRSSTASNRKDGEPAEDEVTPELMQSCDEVSEEQREQHEDAADEVGAKLARAPSRLPRRARSSASSLSGSSSGASLSRSHWEVLPDVSVDITFCPFDENFHIDQVQISHNASGDTGGLLTCVDPRYAANFQDWLQSEINRASSSEEFSDGPVMTSIPFAFPFPGNDLCIKAGRIAMHDLEEDESTERLLATIRITQVAGKVAKKAKHSSRSVLGGQRGQRGPGSLASVVEEDGEDTMEEA
eukprot:gb/GFBE01066838.1/.p1 GENE.gb/GFBE01066838.1/~~gb/GFBE01066838.1/.p1  ORF type:complete len:574 (+),score=108.89 gb/GFBE01066838.1/:1-1722(+)